MADTRDRVNFEWPNVQERPKNVYVETQSKEETDQQTYDEITGNSSINAIYNSRGDFTHGSEDRRKALETESVKNVAIIPRKMLVFLIVVVVFSFLVSAASLGLELKPILLPEKVSNETSTEDVKESVAEIKNDIKTLKSSRNMTGTIHETGLFSEVKKPLDDIKEDIRALRANLTETLKGNDLFSKVKQPLAGIKEDIRALQYNLTASLNENDLSAEVKQPLTDIQKDIKALKRTVDGALGENGLISEVKKPLAEIKEEIRALKDKLTNGVDENGGFYSFCIIFFMFIHIFLLHLE